VPQDSSIRSDVGAYEFAPGGDGALYRLGPLNK
jgi:hypothetical protein